MNVVYYSDGDYKEIPFDWSSEVYNGIYMMKIRDTIERFENSDFSEVLYPVFAGNFGLKEMKGEINRTDITAIKMV